ncbi:hypothetical protein BpHYR1_019331 [Brachionus plicatilis]|uniref:Uncharacterized protein n=1 Tax=Brachionus plicatilis TaxID=10195 RepID=A0A3M7QKL4_BRAPC|nr:hypothetical protein BpHYR1_019331 [Brachionus plicatilis]
MMRNNRACSYLLKKKKYTIAINKLAIVILKNHLLSDNFIHQASIDNYAIAMMICKQKRIKLELNGEVQANNILRFFLKIKLSKLSKFTSFSIN